MVTFQQAYEAAAARYAPEDWASLSAPKIIQVIYEEMRRLDAEDAGAMADAHLSEHKGARTVWMTAFVTVRERMAPPRLFPAGRHDGSWIDLSIVRHDNLSDGCQNHRGS